MSVHAAPIRVLHLDTNYQRVKRIVDIVFTLLIMVPLCIVTAIVALMIRLDSKGPIFFRQKRVGQNGSEFEMLKFRSMYHNSDDALHRKAIQQFMNGDTLSHEEDSSKRYKLTNDARVTRSWEFSSENQHRRTSPVFQCSARSYDPGWSAPCAQI